VYLKISKMSIIIASFCFLGKSFQKGARACALKSIKTTNVHHCILQVFALFTLISNIQSYMHNTLLCCDIFQVSSRKIWIYIISQWFDPFFLSCRGVIFWKRKNSNILKFFFKFCNFVLKEFLPTGWHMQIFVLGGEGG